MCKRLILAAAGDTRAMAQVPLEGQDLRANDRATRVDRCPSGGFLQYQRSFEDAVRVLLLAFHVSTRLSELNTLPSSSAGSQIALAQLRGNRAEA